MDNYYWRMAYHKNTQKIISYNKKGLQCNQQNNKAKRRDNSQVIRKCQSGSVHWPNSSSSLGFNKELPVCHAVDPIHCIGHP